MEFAEVSRRIRDHVGGFDGVASPEAIGDDTDLVATGVMSSMQFVEFVGFLEAEFGIEIDPLDVDLVTFMTIAGAAGYVVERPCRDS